MHECLSIHNGEASIKASIMQEDKRKNEVASMGSIYYVDFQYHNVQSIDKVMMDV